MTGAACFEAWNSSTPEKADVGRELFRHWAKGNRPTHLSEPNEGYTYRYNQVETYHMCRALACFHSSQSRCPTSNIYVDIGDIGLSSLQSSATLQYNSEASQPVLICFRQKNDRLRPCQRRCRSRPVQPICCKASYQCGGPDAVSSTTLVHDHNSQFEAKHPEEFTCRVICPLQQE